MNKLIAELILYSSISNDAALSNLMESYESLRHLSYREVREQKPKLLEKVNKAVKLISRTAERYGFSGNVWQHYLTLLLVTDENPFTLQAEGRTLRKTDSISTLAMWDYTVLKELFRFDFSELEQKLEIRQLSCLLKYKPSKNNVGAADYEKGRILMELSGQLASADSGKEMFGILSGFYKTQGVGLYGLNTAFRIAEDAAGLAIIPVQVDSAIRLSDLIGYELQKKQLKDNTAAFCKGKKSNDVLLYGDNGTGKSTSIKAILNEYSQNGLRLVEVNKYQFRHLPELIARIEERNYKFIIFIDDLSFEEDEIEYKFLKSVIEGGIENRPDNILIYATSNRRHLIKELWDDRKDMEYSGEIHHSDTIEEKISLSSRFGVTINFEKPNKKEYEEIVLALAKKEGLKVDQSTLLAEADRWELRHGGFTGRVARQFINYMLGQE